MGDYIDREELLTYQYNASHSNWPQLAEMVVSVKDIEDAPAADVAQVVHGRWRESGPLLECQSCGEIYSRLGGNAGKLWNYCPNCGAKMDGGGDDEM